MNMYRNENPSPPGSDVRTQKSCAPCYVCPAHLHADRRTEPYSNTVSVHKRALLSSIDLTVVLKTGTVTGRIQYTLSSFRVKPIYVNQHTVNQHTDMAACLCAWRLPPDLWLPALPKKTPQGLPVTHRQPRRVLVFFRRKLTAPARCLCCTPQSCGRRRNSLPSRC